MTIITTFIRYFPNPFHTEKSTQQTMEPETLMMNNIKECLGGEEKLQEISDLSRHVLGDTGEKAFLATCLVKLKSNLSVRTLKEYFKNTWTEERVGSVKKCIRIKLDEEKFDARIEDLFINAFFKNELIEDLSEMVLLVLDPSYQLMDKIMRKIIFSEEYQTHVKRLSAKELNACLEQKRNEEIESDYPLEQFEEDLDLNKRYLDSTEVIIRKIADECSLDEHILQNEIKGISKKFLNGSSTEKDIFIVCYVKLISRSLNRDNSREISREKTSAQSEKEKNEWLRVLISCVIKLKLSSAALLELIDLELNKVQKKMNIYENVIFDTPEMQNYFLVFDVEKTITHNQIQKKRSMKNHSGKKKPHTISKKGGRRR